MISTGGLGILAVPLSAMPLSASGAALACIESPAGGFRADDAPGPAQARIRMHETKTTCPDLPEPWIAAVMAQESGFRPDAYAPDANGGTWGLFQLNASIWTNAYGHPWSSDLDANGIWDVKDAAIHARVADWSADPDTAAY